MSHSDEESNFVSDSMLNILDSSKVSKANMLSCSLIDSSIVSKKAQPKKNKEFKGDDLSKISKGQNNHILDASLQGVSVFVVR